MSLDRTQLQPNLVIQNGVDVYKVSQLEGQSFTAQLLLEGRKQTPPSRTTVRRFSYSDLVMFRPVSDKAYERYVAAYSNTPAPTPAPSPAPTAL